MLTQSVNNIMTSEVKPMDELKKLKTTKANIILSWFKQPSSLKKSESHRGSDSTIVVGSTESVEVKEEYPPIQPKKIMSKAVVKKFNKSSRMPHRDVWDGSLVKDVNIGNLLITGGVDEDGLISAKIFSGDKLIRDHCGDEENEKCAVLRVFLKIKNKTYHKKVGINYTLNNWETSDTIDAKWSFSINSEFDLFSVDLPIQFTSPIWNMEFVAFCHYQYSETNIEEVWENSDGNNWSVSVGMNIQWKSFLNGSGMRLNGPNYRECPEEEAMQTGKMIVKREMEIPKEMVPVTADTETEKTEVEVEEPKATKVRKLNFFKKLWSLFERKKSMSVPSQ